MFKKKTKKLEVKSETPNAHKVEIKVLPLVRIEMHESRINGKVQRPEFRISVADRDIITLSPREYDELFKEMLRHKDAGELIHDIAEVHAEEHAKCDITGDKHIVEELIEKLTKVAEKALNE